MTAARVRRSVPAMRIPIRSESEAFRLIAVGAPVVGVCLLVGWLTEALVGVGVFALALVATAIAYLRAANPDRAEPLRSASHARHPHGASRGTRHVLVIANETLSGSALRDRILGEGRARVELDVLAPVLLSRVHYGVSDVDHELEQARLRLERSLRWAREHGIAARGEVGDPSATAAIADELRDFGADEVIVVTHPAERETWQEREQLKRLVSELEVPITHVERHALGSAGERAV